MAEQGKEEIGGVKIAPRHNTEFNGKIAKLSTFDGDINKAVGFVIVYKLDIRIKMMEVSVEEQV